MDNKKNNQLNMLQKYMQVRKQTEEICRPLEIEDYVVQGMDDVSPAKWHLAHTTWFFETLILIPHVPNYNVFNPLFQHLFNSYYQTIGQPLPQSNRGLLSRPTVATVYAYRQFVDSVLQDYLIKCTPDDFGRIEQLFMVGLQHEQQHQELLLMDIKFNYSLNPDFPNYHQLNTTIRHVRPIATEHFIPVIGATTDIGYSGNGFSYDSERPRHRFIIQPFCIANRLVTNGEYDEFIQSDGYKNPVFWLSNGWDCVVKNTWRAPLYWHQLGNKWHEFTLHGLTEMNLDAPVCHVSYYEADAYARWRGMRLPTEMEWEYYVNFVQADRDEGNYLENNRLHPEPAMDQSLKPQQFFGDVWEWTMSAYSPYPAYKAYEGALSEYNGKFMCNQIVLRGGCCVTPRSHIRASYRNFFQADKRWQFSGIRLANDNTGESYDTNRTHSANGARSKHNGGA